MLHALYLLSSQMFIEHSKCGSRLTSSVLYVIPAGITHPGTARRFPHLQHVMYCTDSDAFPPFNASLRPDFPAKFVDPELSEMPPKMGAVPLFTPPEEAGFAGISDDREGVDCFVAAKFEGERAKSSLKNSLSRSFFPPFCTPLFEPRECTRFCDSDASGVFYYQIPAVSYFLLHRGSEFLLALEETF